ncbi:MAG: electron transport complex subunit RsxC [Lachnospiraceae bacterium]|nr:electron transport complex subunit RsxC [Lachnospiraceae bacterium]
MSGLTFKGGIHTFEGKDLTKDKKIIDLLPSSPELVYPLSQHIGAPAKPVVSVGDRVLRGQKIAEANGFVSANVYSSVSGTVKAIEDRRNVQGMMTKAIVITNDDFYEEAPPIPVRPIAEMTKEEVVAVIKEAGIIGMGGAGFPTHVKLSPKDPAKIHYVIANCAECEPYLTSDYRRMIEEPEKLVAGLKIILCLFEHAKGILAVEDNKPDCIRILKDLCLDEPRISVKVLKTKYPQGSERQLIYASTGRAINSSMLPADAGCIVNNVDTIVAIYHAVIEGRPLMERIVTVTGDAVRYPQNYRVYTGTSYSDLIEAAGGFKSPPEKIISGGPMMGFAMFDTNVPVTKSSSAVTAFLKDPVSSAPESACINCGRCVDSCPSRLLPSKLADIAEHYDEEKFTALNGLECVECGCCSYICPAKRHLTQEIKMMRQLVLSKRKKK